MKRDVDITLNADGTGKIIIGGADLSSAVKGVTMSSHFSHPPRVELDLAAYEVTRLSAEKAEVLIPSDVRDALVEPGWTPPAGEP